MSVQKDIKERAIYVGFFVATILLLYAGQSALSRMSELQETSVAVRDTYEGIADLEEIFRIVAAAESAQRGYVVTGSKEFLLPYLNSKSQLASAISDYKAFALSSEVPDAEWWLLEPLLQKKFEFVQRVLDTYQASGQAAAMDLIRSGTGNSLMQEIAVHLENLKGATARVLNARLESERRATAQSREMLILLSVIAFALFAYGIVFIHQDNQRRKILEGELVLARHAAENSAQAKARFLANMSHEIRSPLTAIIGISEGLLRTSPDEPERKDLTKTILSSGKHMLSVINDILDFSKIDAGAMTFEFVPSPVQAIREDVARLLENRAIEKGLAFRFDLSRRVPEAILTDPVRLKQILINLIGNAIKFTGSGSVSTEIDYLRDSEQLSIRVTDTGIGMSSGELSRLFRPFTQADESTSRRFGGSGLGLVITKSLVEGMGGEISVSSKPGVGTVFLVRLKAPERNAVLSEPAPRPALEKLTSGAAGERIPVLVAEDTVDNQKVIAFFLRATGLDLTFVNNGREALDALQSKHFDLVLMDLQMPVMDGVTAVRQMRTRGVTTPVVALSANAMPSHVEDSMKAGFNAYLAKPFTYDDLLATLVKALPQLDDTEVEANQGPSTAPRDEGLYLLTAKFLNGLSERINAIEIALAQSDYVQVNALGHSLRGSAALFGFSELSRKAAHIEKASRNSEESNCRNLFNDLCLEVERLAAAGSSRPPSSGLNPPRETP